MLSGEGNAENGEKQKYNVGQEPINLLAPV